MDIIFEMTVRNVARDGTALLFPEVSVETFWTNLYESPQTVVALYRDHGTSEQFHSELKSDMNIVHYAPVSWAISPRHGRAAVQERGNGQASAESD